MAFEACLCDACGKVPAQIALMCVDRRLRRKWVGTKFCQACWDRGECSKRFGHPRKPRQPVDNTNSTVGEQHSHQKE